MDSKISVGIIAFSNTTVNLERLAVALENRIPDIRVMSKVVVPSSKKLLAWNSAHPADFGDLAVPSEDIERLQSVEILIGDPRLCISSASQSTHLKWIQGFFAGVEGISRSWHLSQKPSYIVTRNGRAFVDMVAQYTLGQILSHERRFAKYHHNQLLKAWNKGPFFRNTKSLTLGILGVGVIGREIARLAKAIHMTVWGLVRTVPPFDQRSRDVDHYRPTNDLPELLSHCDYVCSVLPSTSETDDLLDGDMLSHCKNKASVLINVGRGNVVKNASVIRALNEGWLSHAILDVFETEPLPADSELWSHPQVTITPHVSGFGIDIDEFVEDFADNYQRYKKDEPMNYVVDWSKGY